MVKAVASAASKAAGKLRGPEPANGKAPASGKASAHGPTAHKAAPAAGEKVAPAGKGSVLSHEPTAGQTGAGKKGTAAGSQRGAATAKPGIPAIKSAPVKAATGTAL